MMQLGLIGIGAGAAAALLFASVTSGAWLSIPLFYLAPLPIMIAGLGWSHWAALIAALAGALALGIAFGPVFFFSFLAGAGLPAWWLGYLAMLARPAGNGRRGDRMVSARPAGDLGGRSRRAGRGGRHPQFRPRRRKLPRRLAQRADAYRCAWKPTCRPMPRAPRPAQPMPSRLIDFLVAAIPPAAAVLATITNVLNLWLAATIVKFSGLLKRPWPQLAAMTFPRPLAAALAVAVVLSFVGSLIGIVAGVLSASLLMAYGVLGFAVLHAITRGMASRIFLLGGVYAAVLVFGWPVLALCLLGLIEAVIDLRARIAPTRGPPALT